MVYDPVKRKELYERNKEKNKEKSKRYYEKHREQVSSTVKKYYEDRKQYVVDYITAGEITDKNKWNVWCNKIKRDAKTNKHPYPDDFTNDIMFEMMSQGCFYCGDIATTIDRLDSALEHTVDNCAGCCHDCNISKGNADPMTFVRKAYYRARGKYHDTVTDIWYVHKSKPSMCNYKIRAKKKGVTFGLTKEDFDILVTKDCEYCKRSPTTWFGIDRVIPTKGYVFENTVSCCWDCNTDKLIDDVDTMMARNERIAVRIDTCNIVIDEFDKAIRHNGIKSSSKTVCVHGKVYANQGMASRALVKCRSYVNECIRHGRQIDTIFEITNEFYEEHKDSELYITKDMFIAFDHFYTNIM